MEDPAICALLVIAGSSTIARFLVIPLRNLHNQRESLASFCHCDLISTSLICLQKNSNASRLPSFAGSQRLA